MNLSLLRLLLRRRCLRPYTNDDVHVRTTNAVLSKVYGYPWFSSVRQILDDPEYKPWFLMFNSSKGSTYSPKCDDNYKPNPKCPCDKTCHKPTGIC